jgi:hypothetical protein
MQYQFENILLEQQKKFQDELDILKQQLNIKNSNSNTNIEYLNQIQLLNYELSQEKMLNSSLQDKLKTLKSSQEIDDSKFKLLEEKKSEILLQVEKLKQKYNDTEKQIQLLQEIDEKIYNKKEEIVLAVKNNLEIYNNNDKIEIINLEQSNKNNNTYTYKITNKLDFISAIELINYSFPESIFNITPHNNILYYSTSENNQIICSEDIFYQKRANVKVLGLPVGNYSIDYLIEMLSSISS